MGHTEMDRMDLHLYESAEGLDMIRKDFRFDLVGMYKVDCD
jgi:hypothetical protein